jgi:peroxiredoxin
VARLTQAAQLAFIVVAASAVYGFVRTGIDAERRRVCGPLCALRPEYAAMNRLAPDFELPSLEGQRVRLSSYRGRVVVLNFWTKHCKPCLEEMPALAELARWLRASRHGEVVTVCTDESPEDARATLASVLHGPPPFVVLHDPNSDVVTGKFGTKLYPETWFIDPGGVIRARFDGPRDWDRAVPLDLVESLREPVGCRVTFERGVPTGNFAGLCE